MQKQKEIQNLNIFPDTNYFVYRNKQFPFKIDFFKYSSNFFKNSQIEILNDQYILLLDLETENNLDLSDDTINDFINYVQGQKISLTNENVVFLHYLSQKYEVESLLNVSNEYIKDHHQELVIDILLIQQSTTSINTETYENALSDHLSEYIEDDRLLKLKVPIIDRILSKHKIKGKNQIENKKIIEFLFKYLDIHGKEASVLFYGIDFSEFGLKYLNLLNREYSSTFDFHYVNSSMIKTMYDEESSLLSNIITYEEKQKEHEKIIEDYNEKLIELKSEFTQSKLDHNRQLEEYKLEQNKFKSEINELRNYINEIETEQKCRDEELKKQFEKDLKSINDAINQIKSEQDQQKIEIIQKEQSLKNQYENEIDRINDEIKQIKTLIIEIKKEQNQLKIDQTQNEESINNNRKKEIDIIHEKINQIKSEQNQQKIEINQKEQSLKNQYENEIDRINDEMKQIKTLIIEIKKEQNQHKPNQIQNEESIKSNNKIGIDIIGDEINQNESNSLKNNIKQLESLLDHDQSNEDNDKSKGKYDENMSENDEINILDESIQAFDLEQDKKEEEINDLSISILNQRIDINTFNDMEGEEQKPNINDARLTKLLSYLSNENQNSQIIRKKIPYVFLLQKDDPNSVIAGINYEMTEVLYQNEKLNSAEFTELIDNFDEIIIEICYPSPQFDDIYQNILNLRSSRANKLNIGIFITEIDSTNDKFHRNKHINYLRLGSTVKNVEKSSFGGCSSLKQVIIPSSVNSMKSNAFIGCRSLKRIAILAELNQISSYAFQSCRSLRHMIIPPSVEIIKKYAFSKCTSLTQITIPSSINKIENHAFWGCSLLKQVLFEDNSRLNSIENSVFDGCNSLEKIFIPSSVKSIGNFVFNNCDSLVQIAIPSSVLFNRAGMNSNVKIISS